MKHWKSILVSPHTKSVEAIKLLEKSGMQIVLVVDDAGKLLGVVTDGDIRRAILGGRSLEEPVEKVMCATPVVAKEKDGEDKILEEMRRKGLNNIPIVDESGRVTGLRSIMDMVSPRKRDNLVVLMAGGLGTRLRPLTEQCPKPMLEVGDRPILETIVESFTDSGFCNICISVNYKNKAIEDHFGDGSRWGINLTYVREEKPMGTAGALSLLPARPTETFLVMNADLITRVNFLRFLDFHYEHAAVASMAVRKYDLKVPYGVIRANSGYLSSIDEKPVKQFFVNAGIYILEPAVLDDVPRNEFYNMTDLFNRLLSRHAKIATFPIHEYWIDVGNLDDLVKANNDYYENF